MMRATALALSVVLLSGTAIAQTTTAPSTGTPATTAPSTSPVPSTAGAGAAAAAGAGALNSLRSGQMRADDIIGTRVYGPNDANVGSVDDIIVNTSSRMVEAAVLSVGGFLGIGNKLVSIPIDQLQMGQDGRLSISLTRDQLEQAPGFEYNANRGSGATGGTTGGTGGLGGTSGSGAPVPPPGGTTGNPPATR